MISTQRQYIEIILYLCTMNKIDFRTLSETERFAFRRQAIRLKKSGRSQKEIAQIIGIRPATICQWCKDYDHEGQKGLTAKKRGVKSEDNRHHAGSIETKLCLVDTQSCKRIGLAGVTNNYCRDHYGGLFEEMGFYASKAQETSIRTMSKGRSKVVE